MEELKQKNLNKIEFVRHSNMHGREIPHKLSNAIHNRKQIKIGIYVTKVIIQNLKTYLTE